MGTQGLFCAAAAVGVALSVLGVPSGTSGAHPHDSVIEMSVDGAPSIVAQVEPRLYLDGNDVTDRYCGGYGTEGDDPRPIRRCPGVPDGVYSARITGLPLGAVSGVWCTDILVAGTEDADALPVDVHAGGGFGTWGCEFTVARPGVLVTNGGVFDEPVLPLVFFDADGTSFVADCEEDLLFDAVRRWCTGFDPDVPYLAVPQGIPPGQRATVRCSSAIGAAGSDTDVFSVSALRPLIECQRPTVFDPLIVLVGRETASESEDVSWLSDVGVAVTSVDGSATGSCAPSQLAPDDDFAFVEFGCRFPNDGSYVAAVSGLPADARYSTTCDPVEVDTRSDLVVCAFAVVFGTQDYPPQSGPVPPDDFPPLPGRDLASIGELPVTGATTTSLLGPAAGLVAVGVVMLLVAVRRRSIGVV